MTSGLRHLLVTGASSGIGAAVVDQAVADGWVVTACARRQDRLQDLAERHGPRVVIASADVTDLSSLERVINLGCGRFGPLAAVAANAGRGVDGEIVDLAAEDLLQVYNVNVAGVHRTLRAALPHLGPGGRFVAVSSIVSAMTVPRMGAYCATKHALEAWASAARMELADRGIQVCTCCPGTVATEFFTVAPRPGKQWTWRPGAPMSPERVARTVLRQAAKGRPRQVILPLAGRLTVAFSRLVPGVVEWLLIRRLGAMRRSEAAIAHANDSQHPP